MPWGEKKKQRYRSQIVKHLSEKKSFDNISLFEIVEFTHTQCLSLSITHPHTHTF